MLKHIWFILIFLISMYGFTQNLILHDSVATYKNHIAFNNSIHSNRVLAKNHLDTLYAITKRNNFPKSSYFYHQDAGYFFFTAHEMDSSKSNYESALHVAKKLNLPFETVDSKIWLGNHEYFEGNFTKAKSLYEDVLSESKKIQYSEGIASAYFGLSAMESDQKKILAGNSFTEIPETLSNVPNLSTLILTGNQIEEIPVYINNFSSLEELILWGNQITELPEQLWAMTNLTKLDMNDNQLTSIPAEIGNMTQFLRLNFQNNNITSVPEEMGQLTNLLTLNLSENDLTSIPQEVCDLETLHGTNIIIEETITCD